MRILIKIIFLAIFFQPAFASCPEDIESCLEETQKVDSVTSSTQIEAEDDHWIDTSREYLDGSADSLARWIDRFFGVQKEDIESAYSSLRLTFVNDWEEGEGNSEKIRLRGKVHLPRINERLSLIFSDDDSDEETLQDDLGELSKEKEETKLSLQYKALADENSRVDFRLGLRSSLKARAYVRYRYDFPVAKESAYSHRITEKLYFIDGEGFGLESRYELDKTLDTNRLLRWSNRLEFAEETNGVAWSTGLSLNQRLNQHSALSWFVKTHGETRPDYLTTNYGLGVRYRRNFLRPWLFYELEPAYAWLREEPEDDREGTALFTFRLEVFLDDL